MKVLCLKIQNYCAILKSKLTGLGWDLTDPIQLISLLLGYDLNDFLLLLFLMLLVQIITNFFSDVSISNEKTHSSLM